LADSAEDGIVPGMTTSPNPWRGFCFLAEVIQHAVWLYHCFSLSLRDVETVLAARGVFVSYESIRKWRLHFGRLFATAPNAPPASAGSRATSTPCRCR